MGLSNIGIYSETPVIFVASLWHLPSGKLTWLLKLAHVVRWFTLIYPLKMVFFHSYVSLPECIIGIHPFRSRWWDCRMPSGTAPKAPKLLGMAPTNAHWPWSWWRYGPFCRWRPNVWIIQLPRGESMSGIMVFMFCSWYLFPSIAISEICVHIFSWGKTSLNMLLGSGLELDSGRCNWSDGFRDTSRFAAHKMHSWLAQSAAMYLAEWKKCRLSGSNKNKISLTFHTGFQAAICRFHDPRDSTIPIFEGDTLRAWCWTRWQ